LRSEPTRFAVSAFGLGIPPEAGGTALAGDVHGRLASALRKYLDGQPDAKFELEWLDDVTVRRDRRSVDVCLLRFTEAGELSSLEPHLAGTSLAVSAAGRRHAHQAIVEAYNHSRHLPEIERPVAIRRAVRAACSSLSDGQAAYALRLLSSSCLSFDAVDAADPAQRFRPPEFHRRRNLGFGHLTFVMRTRVERPAAPAVDVWVSAHHVGLDGVPLQELVDGLERAWGQTAGLVFPPPDLDRPYMAPRVCSGQGERPVEESLVFVDFSPVLALRAALNARHAAAIGSPATFGAVLAWLLHGDPEFAGVRIASTVDVAASGGYQRDVDVVPLTPGDYAKDGDPWAGFVEFAREFNRLLALSRQRTSPLRAEMQTAGLLPAWAHANAIRSNPAALDKTFGSLCVTIIRDAKVFVAPMTDLGLERGFYAISNLGLPSVNGGRVASVSIKGDAGRIGGHAAALKRLISRSERLLGGDD
jgi:hypothetical protein